MYKVKFLKPIKTTNDLYSRVKQAYIDGNIPVPYPAANKQLQLRLTQFFSKGISNEESTSFFDKVNSNRVYALEKHDQVLRLMMLMKEKEETKKLIVLPIDEEIQVIVSSFIHVFEQTGFIESAPKCHKRLHNVYAISNKRIRIVQRILAKFIAPALHIDENNDVQNRHFENEDDENEVDENEDVENEDVENEDIENEGSGNEFIGNEGSGNEFIGNEGSGNKFIGNEGSENKVNGNEGSGNKFIRNEGSGNKFIRNKGSGNKVNGNEGSGNKFIGNEGSGNKFIRNEGSGNKVNGNEGSGNKVIDINTDDQYRNAFKPNSICNDDNLPSHAPMITRSKSKLNKIHNIKSIKRTNVAEPDQKRKKSKMKLKQH